MKELTQAQRQKIEEAEEKLIKMSKEHSDKSLEVYFLERKMDRLRDDIEAYKKDPWYS